MGIPDKIRWLYFQRCGKSLDEMVVQIPNAALDLGHMHIRYADLLGELLLGQPLSQPNLSDMYA